MEFNISKTEIQKALDSRTNELTVVMAMALNVSGSLKLRF
jgi:hypothetical protein